MLPGLKHMALRLAKVHLVGDLYERSCDRGFVLPLDAKRRQRLACVRKAGMLFIHIPKNAGMSISEALYGRQIKHASIRYYQKAAPRLLDRVTSCAIIRDPIERFASSLRYAQAGGTRDNRVSRPFRELYRSFVTAEHALDHLETAQSIYDIDHIFRPQSWYITDHNGHIIVDKLFPFHDLGRIVDFLDLGCRADMTHLNASKSARLAFTAGEIERIRNFYASDLGLVDRVVDASMAVPPLSRGIARLPDQLDHAGLWASSPVLT